MNWTITDEGAALEMGWFIMDTAEIGNDPVLEIVRDEDGMNDTNRPIFKNDREAFAFVVRAAVNGCELSQKALKYIEAVNG